MLNYILPDTRWPDFRKENLYEAISMIFNNAAGGLVKQMNNCITSYRAIRALIM